MPRLATYASMLCLLAGAALACPAATDMARGVKVETLSPRGEQSIMIFRKTGPGRIDLKRTTHAIFSSTYVEQRLHHGLLLASQSVPPDSAVLKDETYTYPDQPIAQLRLAPGAEFTIRSEMQASDGFRKDSTTTYRLGALNKDRVAGCLLYVLPITATEDWDGSKTVFRYLYFPRLGFAVETEAKYPGKTFTREIMEIGAAK